MNKILMTAVAVIALTATAHAMNTLPQSMMGTWCTDRDLTYSNHNAYYRIERRPCEDVGPTIRPHGYSFLFDECIFQRVTPDGTGGYWAITHCEAYSEGGSHRPIGRGWTSREHYKLNRDGYLVMDEIGGKDSHRVS
jgi:hypothetical protein